MYMLNKHNGITQFDVRVKHAHSERMHIAIVWTSVSLNIPIRGICVVYSNESALNPKTGIPDGRWHAFAVKTLGQVSGEETTYTLHKLTDDEIELLHKERKLAEQVYGPIINHDFSFQFNTGVSPSPNDGERQMFIPYKPFTPNKDSEIDVFTLSDIANLNPWDVVQGIAKFP